MKKNEVYEIIEVVADDGSTQVFSQASIGYKGAITIAEWKKELIALGYSMKGIVEIR